MTPRPATPARWRQYLDRTQEPDSVLVVNQLNSNLSHQLAGLRAHAAAGTRVRYVELGNEMYDSSRPDVVKAYPSGSDYAAKMRPWVDAIHEEFPGAKVALVGAAAYVALAGPREAAWNQQVLQEGAAGGADAATIHIYPSPIHTYPPPGGSDPLETGSPTWLLSHAFENAQDNAAYAKATIPSHLRLWITEWGMWGDDAIRTTWLQGLYRAAVT